MAVIGVLVFGYGLFFQSKKESRGGMSREESLKKAREAKAKKRESNETEV